jgi:hypothetical protein
MFFGLFVEMLEIALDKTISLLLDSAQEVEVYILVCS